MNKFNKSQILVKNSVNSLNAPNDLRKHEPKEVVDTLLAWHKAQRAQYLYSLIHPEYAVQEGIQVKLYSDVPIPSSSIGIRQMFNIRTSTRGTFELIWSPNFLATEGALSAILDGIAPSTSQMKTYGYAYSNLFVSNGSDLTGSGSKETFGCLPGFMPMALLQKYRLVSAVLKVKYNGSVLNQSGTLISCATYETFPVVASVATCTSTVESPALDPATGMSLVEESIEDPTLQRWTNFDIIRNGQWNYSHNITADANGIECLYVPVDPSSKMFYDVGDYYGTSRTNSQDTQTYDKSVQASGTSDQYNFRNIHILPFSESSVKYVIAGHNLPTNAQCIQIEVFYNFEVIADPTIAPLIRSSLNNTFDWDDNRRITELFREVSRSGLIRRAVDKAKQAFPRFARATIKWGPRLWPLIRHFI